MERRRTPHNLTLRIMAEEDHTRAHLMRLHTVAVELHLVHPAAAGRHALCRHRAAGWYETELGHSLTM